MSAPRAPWSFLTSYVHAAGHSEVPAVYHWWSAASLLAACVGDRVGLMRERIAGQPDDTALDATLGGTVRPMSPNMYVFLIGPSGTGKNVAIERAKGLLPASMHHFIGVYDGRITGPRICDKLGRRLPNGAPPPTTKMWLVTPELVMGVGRGEQADNLFKLLTELYGGGSTKEGTRTRGEFAIENPCVNWLAGSTKEWLGSAVGTDAMEGGFFGRILPVWVERAAERVFDITLPEDYAQVVADLRDWLDRLSKLSGVFAVERAARDMMRAWYMGRPEPLDPVVYPWWQRQRAHIEKLAMVLSLAESTDLRLTLRHMNEARSLIDSMFRYVPEVLGAVGAGPVARDLQLLATAIRQSAPRAVTVGTVLKRVWRHGIDAARVRDLMPTLVQMELVKRDEAKLVWTGRMDDTPLAGGPSR